MIKSMTGFGRGEYRDEKRSVVCEVKSVNHRYLDVNIKMPRRYIFAEDAVRRTVKDMIRRGKVEVGFQVETFTDDDVQVDFNEALAKKYQYGLSALAEKLGRSSEAVSIEYLASLPDVMTVVPRTGDEEEMTAAMVKAAAEALSAHAKMREIVSQMRVSWEESGAFAREDREFHQLLFSSVGNPVLMSLLNAIWAVDSGYQLEEKLPHLANSVVKHEAIVEALEEYDYLKFAHAMYRHYSSGKYQPEK